MSQPPETDRAGPHPHLLSCDRRCLLKFERLLRHAAPSSASVTPSDACTVQRTSCATRTFAHGHAHAASPRDSPIHNTELDNGRTDVAIRNSRRGRKLAPDFFCCVTTRRVDSAVKLVQPVPASATDVGPDACGADELPWRLSLFAFELRAVGDATAAVLPPASDAPAADIRAPDSNADSSTAPRRSGHSLSADKCVVEIDSKSFPAAMTVTRCYTASVPREVLLPSGPPDRLCKSRSGTSFEASHIRKPHPAEILSQPAGHRQSFPPSPQPQRTGRVASSSPVTQLQRDRKNREGNAEGNAGF